MVGITNGEPSATNPAWQIKASSKISSTTPRSYRAFSRARLTRVRSVDGSVMEPSWEGAHNEQGVNTGSVLTDADPVASKHRPSSRCSDIVNWEISPSDRR